MGMIVSWMLIAAAIGAFAITALSGCFVIPALRKLHFGQTIREDGPTWHNKKQGTPTMGGLCFIFGILLSCGLVYAGFQRYAADLLGIIQVRAAMLALFLAFGSGLIGFLDDYIKVVKHRNLGLLAWQKLVMQVAVTGCFMAGLQMQGLLTTVVMLPFVGAVDLGVAFYPIAFLGIIFLVNAVNLTDGLDGLCSCVTFVSMLGYLLAASMLSFYHVAVLATATAAAAAGFLVWNFYPAKVFMGDTGSMFFGGMVTALAFIMGRPELVFFFGIVYIWDAMTVVIQRVYYKATHGKRIFRMTPIHHAFEMRGWREVKIDFFFSLIALIGVVLGLMYIYLG
ncbi:MAG: phospho-N-acetylmuramoyl-pentapeptide-transferase [Gemmiger sp.]|uniref:phospho-N-acetylmuramoyl-pentapeptide- transferase n=1 Tax=Gemmiger sp. TaxID=2049027 RepID=UPI002E78F5A1|nr:phospho-N-acetylmuramoyl-pentapeptide-transferase [Gemmiger sp.]MEE0800475.1 phospho-N-acetylmuramoyl-pentapeptide-transferase [Gemmiger sp.]